MMDLHNPQGSSSRKTKESNEISLRTSENKLAKYPERHNPYFKDDKYPLLPTYPFYILADKQIEASQLTKCIQK